MHPNSTVGIRPPRPLMSMDRALELLRLLRRDGSASREEIQEALGITRATVYRLLGEMRMQLGVCVDYEEARGGYRITHWGVIDRRRVR